MTEVEVQGATGGRRGPGSANHCMHGKDAVVEEILDWRPYDYVTDRTILDTPSGPIKLLHTVEFEPTHDGHDHPFPIRPAKTKREKELMETIGPAYGAALESGLPSLVAQLRRRARGARGGPRPRARAGHAQAGRSAGRAPAAGDRRLGSPGRAAPGARPVAAGQALRPLLVRTVRGAGRPR